jgi:hypothetical protein
MLELESVEEKDYRQPVLLTFVLAVSSYPLSPSPWVILNLIGAEFM